MFLYAGGVVVGVWALPHVAPSPLRRLSERQALGLTALFLLALGLAVLVGYPLANSGRLGPGSDADEALIVAGSRLLAGQYPYYGLLYTGNLINPFPGAIFLGIPFVALNIVAAQNVVWLALFLIVLRTLLLDARHTLGFVVTLFLLAPGLLHQCLTGTTFLANSLYVAVSLLLLVWAVHRRHRPLTLAATFLLGITMAARLNFLALLPIVWAYVAQRQGWRPATLILGGVALTFGLVTIPFWLYDPAGFAPLHHSGVLANRFDSVLPHSQQLFSIVTLLVACALMVRPLQAWDRLLRASALVLAVPVVLGVMLPLLPPINRLYIGFGHYIQAALLLVAVLFWRRIQFHAPAVTT